MRSLPFQSGTIRIASIAGERRRIPVSGLAKVRLLWLFRNFYILDFPVLDKQQQQLIAKVWNAASRAGSTEVAPTRARLADDSFEDAIPDLSSLDLIGTVEGYSPQLYPALVHPPTVPAKEFHVGDRIKLPSPNPFCVRIVLPGGLRAPALWTAMAVLLLVGAIALGSKTLGSKALEPVGSGSTPQGMPPSRVSAAAPANPVRATPPEPAPTFVLARASAALPPPAVASSPAPAAEASSVLPLRPPDVQLPAAIASSESSPDATPPRPRLALRTKPSIKPEVMIRVHVDSEGRAQAIQLLHGSRTRLSAALHAARRFSFEPCASSADCDHLLIFTDYGDASIVQRIE
jgi:hypothetical protein